ncbi:hypothetical protein BB934_27700 (plasmid) [Microvirga ossetica]|uniref:Uncharacterized protein n=1 Tax=Microvirga ossetica TaxID=1882682 RepID=A0A1B2EQ87_9HYPH|nr:hypothetical protein BB934_27700 [Microvirga ossetica]
MQNRAVTASIISDVMYPADTIADQTDLPALNAAIEAHAVGDQVGSGDGTEGRHDVLAVALRVGMDCGGAFAPCAVQPAS